MDYRGITATDSFDGGPGDDIYNGTAGNDTAHGNGGNDILVGGGGSDTLNGDDGNDALYAAALSPNWYLPYYNTPGVAPLLDTGVEVDTLNGGNGDDRIYAGYGDNVDGGAGTDSLMISFAGASTGVTVNFDLLYSGPITVGGGTIQNIENLSWVDGSNYADAITGSGSGYDSGVINGLGGDDTLVAGYITGSLNGGDGNDHLDGSLSQYLQQMDGGAGDDVITGGKDYALVFGGSGNDLITSAVTSHGNSGNDTINAVLTYSNSPPMYGDEGDDILNGAGADITLVGGDGADTIHGGGGNDKLYAGGIDPLYTASSGNIARDQADFGTDHDHLYGDAGDDLLSIGYGDDADGGTGTNSLTLALGGPSGVTLDTANIVSGGTTALNGGTISNIQRIDTIWGSAFADTITIATQATTATVYGGAGDDHLNGGASAVVLYGEAGNDVLSGGSAGDMLHGGAGGDTINGNDGDDTIFVDSTDDALATDHYDGGAGTDTLRVANASGALDISAVSLTGIEALVADRSYYTTLDVLLTAAQLDAFTAITVGGLKLTTGGAVSMAGAAVITDSITLAAAGNSLDLTGTLVNDAGFRVFGGIGNDIVTGSAFADIIAGGGGNDTINGGDGSDILNGGAGADAINGGDGNDVITYDNAADFAAGETINGGAGFDIVRFSGFTIDLSSAGLTGIEGIDTGPYISSGVSLTAAQLDGLSAVAGNFTLTTAGSVSMAGVVTADQYGNGPASLIFTMSAAGNVFDMTGYVTPFTNVFGQGGADVITGSAGTDYLYGGGGNDIINGGDGDDLIGGGTGADTLSGGAGNDVFALTSAGDIAPGDTFDGGDGTDILRVSGIFTVNVSTADLSGVEGINSIFGTVQLTAAQLDGLVATTGNFVLTTGGSVSMNGVVNAANGNNNFTLSDVGNVFDLTGFVPGYAQVNGGAANDTIIGNASYNWLRGGGGNDLLIGAGGGDLLDGGAGVDTVSYAGSVTAVHVNLTAGTSAEGDSYLSIENVIGSAFNDTIVGNIGVNWMTGGTGNDTYYADRADDLVFENAGEGTDTVVSTAGYYLYANIENLTLAAGAGDIFGVGNELANVITGNGGSNLLIAGAGDDTVHGGAGVDSLFGQDGNDHLFGDAGIDYLVGGTGDDVLDGGTEADALYGEDGNDTLIGGSDFQTDILVGGNGNDILHGDSGQGDYDLMDGGAGDDAYYVDTFADLTFEGIGGGTDTVYANISGAGYYLYANVENLVLQGSTAYGVGNELDNHLTGSDTANWLLGGGGNDVLNGKGGNDVLFGESGADTFIFEQGTGGDVIGDFLAGTDKIDLSAFGFANYQTVVNSMHEVNGTTAIDLGAGDFIVLNGVAEASLHAGDFILGGGTSTQVQSNALHDVAARLEIGHGGDIAATPALAQAELWFG